jgi:hypothetical protein
VTESAFSQVPLKSSQDFQVDSRVRIPSPKKVMKALKKIDTKAYYSEQKPSVFIAEPIVHPVSPMVKIPSPVLKPSLSEDARSLRTIPVLLNLNPAIGVQQQKSFILAHSNIGMGFSIPSNTCQGMSGKASVGADEKNGFYVSAEIEIPGDVDSQACRDERSKIAEQIDTMCEQFTKKQSQYILPDAWVKTMSACKNRKPA